MDLGEIVIEYIVESTFKLIIKLLAFMVGSHWFFVDGICGWLGTPMRANAFQFTFTLGTFTHQGIGNFFVEKKPIF
jgi:hypothetical protein